MGQAAKRKYRVIGWGTGIVGRQAVEAVLTHPDLELVGLYVARPENAGRDAGELVGLPPCGVKTNNNMQEILAMEADCVLHIARMVGDLTPLIDQICTILESGKSVISTTATPLIYPKALGPEIYGKIDAACKKGRSSFHSTGIQPGFMPEVMPLTLSGIMRKATKLTMQEILDYSTYDNEDALFNLMRFGSDMNEPPPAWRDEIILASFKSPLMMIADGLGAKVDEYRVHFHGWAATRDLEISCGTVKKGTLAAQRYGCTAVIEGRDAIVIEHITRLGGGDQAPDWPQGKGYRIYVEGEPSMRVEIEIAVNGEDENDQACLATALHAVNAIPAVCSADPGVQSFLELPLLLAKGAFNRKDTPQR